MRNRITLLLLAGVCVLCLLGAVFVAIGNSRNEVLGAEGLSSADGPPTASRDATVPPGSDREGDSDRPAIRRVGEIGPGPTATEDVHLPDLREAAEEGSRAGGATDDVIDPASLPMATKGREQGIDTAMDDDWTPGGEAEQWFGRIQIAFEAARPLTPDLYNEILGDHRDTTVDVFKRAGEIGDVKGPEAGIQFLDEYNAMVDTYKREAYGETPR